jgi:hypothetical protein
MTFLTRLEEAQKLWKYVMPTVILPPNKTWVRWLAASPDADFEKVMLSVPTRFKDGLPSDEEIYRFVSAVLGRFRQARQRTFERTKI